MSRTSNYHIFDASRGGVDAKLSKKSGHYIGKLRRDKDKPIGCFTLYNASREKQELAAFVYDIPSLALQVKEGQPPRKMQAIIPKIAAGREVNDPAVNTNRLIEHLHNGTWKHGRLLAVQTKPPKFHEGKFYTCTSHHLCYYYYLTCLSNTALLCILLYTLLRPVPSELQRQGSNSIRQEYAVGK